MIDENITVTIESSPWTPKVEQLDRPTSLLGDLSGMNLTEVQRCHLKELQEHFRSGKLRDRLLAVKDDDNSADTGVLRKFLVLTGKEENSQALKEKLQAALDTLYDSLTQNPIVEAISDDDGMDILFCHITHHVSQDTPDNMGIVKILNILKLIDAHMQNIAQAIILEWSAKGFPARFQGNPEVKSLKDIIVKFLSANSRQSVSEIADQFEHDLMRSPAMADYSEVHIQECLRKRYFIKFMIEKPKKVTRAATGSPPLAPNISRVADMICGLVIEVMLSGDTTMFGQ